MSVPTPKHFNIQYSLTYIRFFVDHVRAGNVAQATRMLKLHPELANVRIHLDNRKTVLMEALTSSKANEMVPLLLAKGAHLTGKNTQREDAVMHACARGVNSSVVNLLLVAWDSLGGYDWSLQNAEGKTAFAIACESKSIKLVLRLLDFIRELSRVNGVAVFKLLRRRIAATVEEDATIQLISHPVVQRLVTNQDSWPVPYPLALHVLNAGFASTSIPTSIVDCFLRALGKGWTQFAQTLEGIHQNAIRAISFTFITTADRRCVIPPVMFTFAEQLYRDFKWVGVRQAFLIRSSSIHWNALATMPDDLFRIIIAFLQEPWDQDKAVCVLTSCGSSLWRLAVESE